MWHSLPEWNVLSVTFAWINCRNYQVSPAINSGNCLKAQVSGEKVNCLAKLAPRKITKHEIDWCPQPTMDPFPTSPHWNNRAARRWKVYTHLEWNMTTLDRNKSTPDQGNWNQNVQNQPETHFPPAAFHKLVQNSLSSYEKPSSPFLQMQRHFFFWGRNLFSPLNRHFHEIVADIKGNAKPGQTVQPNRAIRPYLWSGNLRKPSHTHLRICLHSKSPLHRIWSANNAAIAAIGFEKRRQCRLRMRIQRGREGRGVPAPNQVDSFSKATLRTCVNIDALLTRVLNARNTKIAKMAFLLELTHSNQ